MDCMMALICVDNTDGYGFVVNRGELGGYDHPLPLTHSAYVHNMI